MLYKESHKLHSLMNVVRPNDIQIKHCLKTLQISSIVKFTYKAKFKETFSNSIKILNICMTLLIEHC